MVWRLWIDHFWSGLVALPNLVVNFAFGFLLHENCSFVRDYYCSLTELFYSLSLAVQLSLCLPSWLLPFLEAAILDADRQS